MTFRIERAASSDGVILAVSGDIAEGRQAELRTLLHAETDRRLTIDLAAVTRVDLDGAALLEECEARGATLRHVPTYVRARIDDLRQEKTMAGSTTVTEQEGTIMGSDGSRLFHRSWLPPDRARAAVVIVPGFNSHSGYYRWAGQQLAAHRAAVHAVDLRGRGQSDGDRFYVATFDDYLRDVDAMVRVAATQHPGVPLFVLGHSAGGVLACLYALGHQARLAGLICESFAFETPAPEFALAVLKGLSHVFPHAHVLRLKNADFSRDAAVVAAMNADPLIAHEAQPTQTVAELVRADERLRPAFPDITLPVLILHGTADRAARASGSQAFFDAVGSTDKTLKLYDGVYHDPLNDEGRELVLSDIAAWITARLAGSVDPRR
jgi:alpha-beta hydrolase superfamily lysophospholipase/ABC-type transporter Mla MlaB component